MAELARGVGLDLLRGNHLRKRRFSRYSKGVRPSETRGNQRVDREEAMTIDPDGKTLSVPRTRQQPTKSYQVTLKITLKDEKNRHVVHIVLCVPRQAFCATPTGCRPETTSL